MNKNKEKLKTLKDCFLFMTIDDKDRPIHEIEYNELKQVAREWIRELKRQKKEYEIKSRVSEYDNSNFAYMTDSFRYYSIMDQIIWIKHFFNLDDK